MTTARNSQTPIEVLRTGTNIKAQPSQVAIEVLRTGTAIKAQPSQVAIEILRANGAETPIGGSSQPLTIIAC